jgi:putative SOS response-associated peptidase YedK
MCGRVIQSGGPLRYAIVDGMNVRDSRVHNYPPRWNAAPNQELLVIRRNHQTGDVSLDPLRCGLIPYWCNDPKGGRKPINAKCETVRGLPTFRDAYRKRRCIVPVDGFFEWKAIKGQKAKQPYAIAMKDGAPFGIAGIWETGKNPLRANGFGPSLSSLPIPMSWSPTSMIACRSSSRRPNTPAGLAKSPIRVI